jgi:hypothetical protein
LNRAIFCMMLNTNRISEPGLNTRYETLDVSILCSGGLRGIPRSIAVFV